jgi:hypothetical protein
MTRRLLVLIGSPRGLERSTSSQLAAVFTARFEKARWTQDWIHLHEAVRSEDSIARMLDGVDRADVVLLASPLYVDCLPAPTGRALELIAAAPDERSPNGRGRLITILNCGFVEAAQNETAQGICRAFADRARFTWAGGLSIGSAGQRSRRILRALKAAGEAVSSGSELPESAIRLAARNSMPPFLYRVGGNLMWRLWARKLGVRASALRDRPYEPKG